MTRKKRRSDRSSESPSPRRPLEHQTTKMVEVHLDLLRRLRCGSRATCTGRSFCTRRAGFGDGRKEYASGKYRTRSGGRPRCRNIPATLSSGNGEGSGGESEKAGSSAASSDASMPPEFNPLLALSLAGHAFFSYREPIREPYRRETIAKSQVSFLDREYLLKEYKGTLNIRTLAIHLPRMGQEEEIYFALSLGEDIENSATLKGTDSHFSCDQDYEFLLKATKGQRLQIRVWKKRFLRPDELLGKHPARQDRLCSSTTILYLLISQQSSSIHTEALILAFSF